MSEQFPGQPLDQALGQDPRSNPGDQSPAGLPSESIGVPRPRQFRKGLRKVLPYALLVLAFGGLLIAGDVGRVLLILLLNALLWYRFIRLIVRRLRIRRARIRPPARRG